MEPLAFPRFYATNRAGLTKKGKKSEIIKVSSVYIFKIPGMELLFRD